MVAANRQAGRTQARKKYLVVNCPARRRVLSLPGTPVLGILHDAARKLDRALQSV